MITFFAFVLTALVLGWFIIPMLGVVVAFASIIFICLKSIWDLFPKRLTRTR